MILRDVNLPGVSYPGESCDFSVFYLKGHSNEIFGLQFFFIIQTWATDQWVKIFSRFCWVNQNFRKNLPGYDIERSQPPRGIILRGVNLPWVSYSGESISPGVSYCGESISPGYHTAGSHSWPRGVNRQFLNCLHRPWKGQCNKNKYDSYSTNKGLHFAVLQKNSRIKFCWLPGVWYCWEVSFFDTKIRITRQKSKIF